MTCCNSLKRAIEYNYINYDKNNKLKLLNEYGYWDTPLIYCPFCGTELND